MTIDRESVIQWAREAWLSEYGSQVMLGGEDVEVSLEDLERFAALAYAAGATAEREACAKLCEYIPYGTGFEGRTFADAIRARGQE
jgi:hypothetical protein